MKKKNISRVKKLTPQGKISVVDIEFIRTRRRSLKLTLAEASKRAGMNTLIQWQKIETGTNKDPQASTLARIAKVLKVSPARLFKKG